MATPSETLERALERAAQPLRDYSRTRTALALSELARQQQLEDRREARAFQIGQEERAAARRKEEIRALTEQQLDLYMARLGLSTEGTRKEKEKRIADHLKTSATNVLRVYNKQEQENQQALKNVVDRLQGVVDKQATPRQKLDALRKTMDDPEVAKVLREKDRDDILKIILTAKDSQDDRLIDAAVQKVYKNIKDNKFLFFGRGGAESASKFYNTFLTHLNTSLEASTQIDATLYMQQFEDLNREAQDIRRAKFQAIRENAAYLPEGVVNEALSTIVPDEGEDEGEDDNIPEDIGAQLDQDIQVAAQTAPPTEPLYTIEPSLARKALDTVARAALPVTRPIARGVEALIPFTPTSREVTEGLASIPKALFGAPESAAPTEGELDLARRARDIRVLAKSITPEESEHIRSLALAMGVKPEEFRIGQTRLRQIVEGDTPRASDEKAIKTLQTLLDIVRHPDFKPLPTAPPSTDWGAGRRF